MLSHGCLRPCATIRVSPNILDLPSLSGFRNTSPHKSDPQNAGEEIIHIERSAGLVHRQLRVEGWTDGVVEVEPARDDVESVEPAMKAL